MAALEELLGDSDALATCKHLLECYKDDSGEDVLQGPEGPATASASFLLEVIGKPTEHVKATLDNLNHALLILKSLRHKAVLSNTGDIIKSLEEANTFVDLLNGASAVLTNIKHEAKGLYGRPISIYRELDRNIVYLERICNVQAYVMECRDVLSTLVALKSETQNLKVTLDDFATLTNVAHAVQTLITKVAKIEKSDLTDIIAKQCAEFKTTVMRVAFDEGLLSLFRSPKGQAGGDPMFVKMLVICHCIFRELDVAPLLTLRLVDELVADTKASININAILEAEAEARHMWQHVFLSQFSEFMSKYKLFLASLYIFCRASNHRIADHLDESELSILKNCPLLCKEFLAQHDPVEVLAPCELYAKRCVGVLQNVLERLEEGLSYVQHSYIVMLVPQLVSIGEATHKELSHLNIPFNLQLNYFKNICEGYAKEFMVNAAERMIPLSKTTYEKCLKILNAHNVCSWSELSVDREVHLASLLVPDLPTDLSLGHIIYEFLDKSHSCETIHRSVLQIANSALQNVMDASVRMTTVYGSRLMLNDGGNKIALKRPNEAQIMNAKVQQYLMSLVDTIEPCLVTRMDKEAQLFKSIAACRSLKMIDCWAEDVGATLWHAVSYISSGDCQEFRWKAKQVLTASQHIVKICNFLCENYFNPFLKVGRMRLFRKLATHAISAFVIYAITVWPLEEEDKISFLNMVTEIEMALAEVLKESLPKLEAEYLASLRRLIFLGDESLHTLMIPGSHEGAGIRLPDDVISLHIMARVVNSGYLSETDRAEFAKAPLHQFLGATNSHAMLQWFRDAMLLYDPQATYIPMYGGRFAEYLSQFYFLGELLNGHLNGAIQFLNAH